MKHFLQVWAFAALLALPPAAGWAASGRAFEQLGNRVTLCSWDRPGHNPYTGDAAAALNRYPDIPADVRARLRSRMEAHRYDDVAAITRDAIVGRHAYQPQIRDMHFGASRVCREVSRAGWPASMQERGLVYCESGHCILVPTVCGNVSRIARRPEAVAPERVVVEDDPAQSALRLAAAPPLQSFDELLALPLGAPLPEQGGAGGPPLPFVPFVPGSPGGGGGAGPAFGVPPSTTPPPIVLPPPDGEPGPPDGTPPPPPVLPPVAAVPEPGTWLLMVVGLGLLAWRQTQRRAVVPRCATQKRS